MKGGVDHEDDDQYEDPLDPVSTVDFNMQGLKSKPIFTKSQSSQKLFGYLLENI